MVRECSKRQFVSRTFNRLKANAPIPITKDSSACKLGIDSHFGGRFVSSISIFRNFSLDWAEYSHDFLSAAKHAINHAELKDESDLYVPLSIISDAACLDWFPSWDWTRPDIDTIQERNTKLCEMSKKFWNLQIIVRYLINPESNTCQIASNVLMKTTLPAWHSRSNRNWRGLRQRSRDSTT